MTALPALPRVMMVVPKYPYPVVGGLERQAHELAKALLAKGIDVQVLSTAFEPHQLPEENVEGVPVHRLTWLNWKGIRFLWTPLDMLWALYSRRETYDVVHLHQHSWFGLFTILCAKALGKPILVKLPNVGRAGPLGFSSQPLGRLKLAILMRSDALVGMSDVSLSELKKAGFPSTRILATPNGVRLEGSQGWTCLNGADRSICRVVFVGRLGKTKQLDTLLYAWSQMAPVSKIPAILELWGDGPLQDDLRRLSLDLGVSDSVIFCGHVNGVRSRLPDMDIFVLPSSAEGNSNAVLEAMAAGLPIVSTRVGGTPMQVGPEGADFLLQPGDLHALSEKLGELIRNPVLRAQLGVAMRRRVERHFDISNVAQIYAEAYKHLFAREPDRICHLRNPLIGGYEALGKSPSEGE